MCHWLTASLAVTLGAGVQWTEAYTAVHARGKTIVGGISTNGTVGAAGGWILGGGHSALTPTFGFGEEAFDIPLRFPSHVALL